MTLSDDLAKATSTAKALEAALAAATADDASDQAALDAALAHVAELQRQLDECRNPPPPPPGRKVHVGISPGISGTLDEIKATLDGMRAVGFDAYRYDVSRASTEPTKGTYKFDRATQIAAECWARDIRPLPCPTYAASWDRQPTNPKFTDGPLDLAALEAYGAAYSRAFLAVSPTPADDDAEWWNEADNVNFWTPAPDPVRYMVTAWRFQKGRLSANPKARLILSGLAPGPDKAPQINPATFVQRAYDSVATTRKRFWHGVGFHPYMGGAPPETIQPWSTMGPIWDRIVATIHGSHNADPLPLIYCTEFGYATSDDSPKPKNVTEQQQGEYLIRQIEMLRSRPDTGDVHVHRWRDFPHGKYPGLTAYNETLGIHFADGRPKKAVAMLKEYLAG